MPISCASALTDVSASRPELGRFRLVAPHCQHKCESQESTDGCGTAMNVTDDQKDRSTEKADQPEKPLHADSLQHRKKSTAKKKKRRKKTKPSRTTTDPTGQTGCAGNDLAGRT